MDSEGTSPVNSYYRVVLLGQPCHHTRARRAVHQTRGGDLSLNGRLPRAVSLFPDPTQPWSGNNLLQRERGGGRARERQFERK